MKGGPGAVYMGEAAKSGLPPGERRGAGRARRFEGERKTAAKKKTRAAAHREAGLFSSELWGGLQMQVLGNREATLEGCSGILEYEEHTVRLRTKGMAVTFEGSDLLLRCFLTDRCKVTGVIRSISFQATGE